MNTSRNCVPSNKVRQTQQQFEQRNAPRNLAVPQPCRTRRISPALTSKCERFEGSKSETSMVSNSSHARPPSQNVAAQAEYFQQYGVQNDVSLYSNTTGCAPKRVVSQEIVRRTNAMQSGYQAAAQQHALQCQKRRVSPSMANRVGAFNQSAVQQAAPVRGNPQMKNVCQEVYDKGAVIDRYGPTRMTMSTRTIPSSYFGVKSSNCAPQPQSPAQRPQVQKCATPQNVSRQQMSPAQQGRSRRESWELGQQETCYVNTLMSMQKPTVPRKISPSIAQHLPALEEKLIYPGAGRSRDPSTTRIGLVKNPYGGGQDNCAPEEEMEPECEVEQELQPEAEPETVNAVESDTVPPLENEPFYGPQHVQIFLQRIAMVMHYLRLFIESGELQKEAVLMGRIRDDISKLYDEIPICEENCEVFIYREDQLKSVEIQRLAPGLMLPQKIPEVKSADQMPFDQMVTVYNGLAAAFEKIVDTMEHFANRSQFQNLLNALFDNYKIRPYWCKETKIDRKTIIKLMERISMVLSYLQALMSSGKPEDEVRVIETINNMIKLESSVRGIGESRQFFYPYDDNTSNRRAVLQRFVPPVDNSKNCAADKDSRNLMSAEKMQDLFSGFEAAFWMIEDEFDRRVFSQRFLINVVNKSLDNKFVVFNDPPPERNLPAYRLTGKGMEFRKIIQRVVIFLGFLRRELEAGRLFKVEQFEDLQAQFLSGHHEAYINTVLAKGLFVHNPDNPMETEIKRLLPNLKVPRCRPIADDDQVPYSVALRLYFKVQGCALRFLQWVEDNFFSNMVDSSEWAEERVQECLTRYNFQSDCDNAPNVGGCNRGPCIKLTAA